MGRKTLRGGRTERGSIHREHGENESQVQGKREEQYGLIWPLGVWLSWREESESGKEAKEARG